MSSRKVREFKSVLNNSGDLGRRQYRKIMFSGSIYNTYVCKQARRGTLLLHATSSVFCMLYSICNRNEVHNIIVSFITTAPRLRSGNCCTRIATRWRQLPSRAASMRTRATIKMLLDWNRSKAEAGEKFVFASEYLWISHIFKMVVCWSKFAVFNSVYYHRKAVILWL